MCGSRLYSAVGRRPPTDLNLGRTSVFWEKRRHHREVVTSWAELVFYSRGDVCQPYTGLGEGEWGRRHPLGCRAQVGSAYSVLRMNILQQRWHEANINVEKSMVSKSIKITDQKRSSWGWDKSEKTAGLWETEGQCSPLMAPYSSVLPFLV